MHRYRTHTCGALGLAEDGKTVRLSGWCHRIRDHGGVLFIDLRDHYGMTQCVVDPDSPAFRQAEKLRSEFVVRIDGAVRKRPAGTENPDMPTGLIEVYVREIEVLGPAGDLPLPVFGDQPYPEDTRLKLPLPRPQAREAAREHHAARPSRRFAAQPHEGAGLLRVPDADPDRLEPRRRARLPRAVAHPSRQVLRAAAGAAAVQAAADDGRLRPLLPDRAVLPRRGPARRPSARRVLPARHRDELRRAGRRVRGDGAGDPRRVRGIRRRQAGDAVAVAAHPVCRSDAQIRLRQARPAQPDRHAERLRPFPRLGLQGVRAPARDAEERGLGDSRAGRRPAHLRRPDELLGAGRGPAGARLHAVLRPREGRDDAAAGPEGDRSRRPRSARQQHRPRAHRGDPRRSSA